MNEQIFILLAQEGGPGGLFDIGATLPLVALQFLVLMFILNSILYLFYVPPEMPCTIKVVQNDCFKRNTSVEKL